MIKIRRIVGAGAVLLVFSVLPAQAAFDGACAATAVEKRDNAIISAWDTFTAARKTALTTRRDSLISAWNNAAKGTRKSALKSAWRTFRSSAKQARRAYKNSVKSAWKTFKSDLKACGGTTKDEGAGYGDDNSLE